MKRVAKCSAFVYLSYQIHVKVCIPIFFLKHEKESFTLLLTHALDTS